jgi:L-aspartate oxidase
MNPVMTALPAETDFIVVGAGIAGLRASVELASAGRVLCLAKREVTESNTQYAQGGIAAALSDDDEVRLHLEDTLKAGDGLCNEEAARILVEEGPPRIEELHWPRDWPRAFSESHGHDAHHVSRVRVHHRLGGK